MPDRRRHKSQGHRVDGEWARPEGGGAQHQPSDPLGVIVGQLLREDSAPRQTEHVELGPAAVVRKGDSNAGQRPHSQRTPGVG